MMSLTTLPTMLSVVSGASPLFLLKAVYPALLAFFPMALFCLTARFTSRRYAYIAALIIVVQSYLFEEMTASRARRSPSIFICLVGVLSDGKLVRAQRLLWTAAFGLGMVLSHYGATYFAIIILGAPWRSTSSCGSSPGPPRSARRGARCAGGRRARRLGLVRTVTHSTSNLSGVVNALRTQGLVLPGGKGHGVVGAYVSGNSPQRVRGEDLQKFAVADYHAHHPFIQPLRKGSTPAYGVQERIAEHPGEVGQSVPCGHAGRDGGEPLMDLLAVVACVVLLLRFRERREVRLMALFGLATLGLLAVIRVSGTLASSYNQERAFLQAMIPLAPGIGCWPPGSAGATGYCASRPRSSPSCSWGSSSTAPGSPGWRWAAEHGQRRRGAQARMRHGFVVTEPELAASPMGRDGRRREDRAGRPLRTLASAAATGRTGGILAEVFPNDPHLPTTRGSWPIRTTPSPGPHAPRTELLSGSLAVEVWLRFLGTHLDLHQRLQRRVRPRHVTTLRSQLRRRLATVSTPSRGQQPPCSASSRSPRTATPTRATFTTRSPSRA